MSAEYCFFFYKICLSSWEQQTLIVHQHPETLTQYIHATIHVALCINAYYLLIYALTPGAVIIIKPHGLLVCFHKLPAQAVEFPLITYESY